MKPHIIFNWDGSDRKMQRVIKLAIKLEIPHHVQPVAPPKDHSYFIVRLRHDGGIIRIATIARTRQAAIETVCRAERAPQSAVQSVKKINYAS
jgi:hypothetical protein